MPGSSPRRRRARSHLEPLGQLLASSLPGTSEAPARASSTLLRAWERAVGRRIAERTRPSRLEKGVLFVKVASSAWAQELDLHATVIIGRMRKLGIDAQKLRFRVTAVEGSSRRPERLAPKAKMVAPLPSSLAQKLEKVPDADLRAVIARAARANMTWQKRVKTATETAGPAAPAVRRGPPRRP